MKVVHSYDTETIGIESEALQINATPEMFNLLSQKIYSHPVEAVVRELTINAIDEMVEANAEDAEKYPITSPTIHLPSQLEPWFEVEDHGRGMSDQKVREVYLTYGASSKLNTNLSSGCLGIGSKSPLAIDDQFTTTTRHGGTQRQYIIFKGDDRRPQVTKVDEITYVGKTGTTIRVSVPVTKINDFTLAVKKVIRVLPVQPFLTGKEIEIDCKVTYENEHGKVFRDGSYDKWAVMGNVQYKIDFDYTHNLRSHTALLFDMGEIDFAASREQLEYTTKTIAAIKRKIEAYQLQMKTDYHNEIDSTSTREEKVRIMGKYHELCSCCEEFNQCSLGNHQLHRTSAIPTPLIGNKISLTLQVYKRNMDKCSATYASLLLSNTLFVYSDITTMKLKRLRKLFEDDRSLQFIVVLNPQIKSATYTRLERYYETSITKLSSVIIEREKSTTTRKNVPNIFRISSHFTDYSYPERRRDWFEPFVEAKLKDYTYYLAIKGVQFVDYATEDVRLILRFLARHDIYSKVAALRGSAIAKHSPQLQPFSKLKELVYPPRNQLVKFEVLKWGMQNPHLLIDEIHSFLPPYMRRQVKYINAVQESERYTEDPFALAQIQIAEANPRMERLSQTVYDDYPLLGKTTDTNMIKEMIEFYKWKENA